MKQLIQRVVKIFQRSCTRQACNYTDNYYGDQVCTPYC